MFKSNPVCIKLTSLKMKYEALTQHLIKVKNKASYAAVTGLLGIPVGGMLNHLGNGTLGYGLSLISGLGAVGSMMVIGLVNKKQSTSIAQLSQQMSDPAHQKEFLELFLKSKELLTPQECEKVNGIFKNWQEAQVVDYTEIKECSDKMELQYAMQPHMLTSYLNHMGQGRHTSGQASSTHLLEIVKQYRDLTNFKQLTGQLVFHGLVLTMVMIVTSLILFRASSIFLYGFLSLFMLFILCFAEIDKVSKKKSQEFISKVQSKDVQQHLLAQWKKSQQLSLVGEEKRDDLNKQMTGFIAHWITAQAPQVEDVVAFIEDAQMSIEKNAEHSKVQAYMEQLQADMSLVAPKKDKYAKWL